MWNTICAICDAFTSHFMPVVSSQDPRSSSTMVSHVPGGGAVSGVCICRACIIRLGEMSAEFDDIANQARQHQILTDAALAHALEHSSDEAHVCEPFMKLAAIPTTQQPAQKTPKLTDNAMPRMPTTIVAVVTPGSKPEPPARKSKLVNPGSTAEPPAKKAKLTVNSNVTAVPKAANATAVPKATKATAVPKATNAIAVPKAATATAVSKATKATAVPKATNAIAVPKAANATSVPKANKATAVPQATNVKPVPKSIRAANETAVPKAITGTPFVHPGDYRPRNWKAPQ